MDNNMIIIFSRLTKSELSECSLFENILEYHYEKFKLFYSLIKNICLKNVDDIVCEEKIDELLIYIHFKTKTFLNNFDKVLKVELNSNGYINAEYFNLDITKSSNNINISIGNKSISKESDIYEN